MRISQRASVIQESAIRKLDLVAAKQTDVSFVRLNIGQPDIPTPLPLMQALTQADSPVLGYGPASGLPECRRAAAQWHGKWSPGLGPEHVAVTMGGSEALLFAFCAVCDPGDEILVPEPFYTNYNGFATVAAARVVPIPTRLEDNFAIPPDEVLDTYVTDKTRVFLFSNPGNPTGAVYGADELRRVAAWARRKGIWLVADEVYRSIWFEQAPLSALELPGHEDHVIVVDSTSKTFSACGLRIGFLISRNLQLMEKIERLGQARLGPMPRAQRAAIAALALPEAFYDELRATYKARVDTMMNALSRIEGAGFHRPEGAFYTMVKLPVDDTEAFARYLVEGFRHEGESVMVAPGPGFYSDPSKGRDQIRLAAVCAPERIERAVELLGIAVKAWNRR